MTSTYPAQIDTTITLPQAPTGTPIVSGDVYNQLRSAVIAMENELGINPSSTNNTVRARLDVIQSIVTNFQGINIGGDIEGTPSSPHVIGIQGRPVSSASPTPNQLLIWNGIAWVPNNIIFAGDLTGNFINQTVTKLQGRPISTTVPSVGQLLEWNGISWSPTSEVFAGDLAGNYSNQTVIKINGATVPIAGSLIIGNILQVSGNSALTYAPVNLGGGSNYIIGVLPSGNQAAQILHGDVVGTTSSNTAIALQGNSVSSSIPSSNQVLTWSGSTWAPTNIPVQFTAGGDLIGTATNQNVASIQGLKVTAGNTAMPFDVAAINYNPVLSIPTEIAFSGSSLWIVNSGANYITQLATGYSSFTNHNLYAATQGGCIAANGTYIFVGVTNGGTNKLVVLDANTGTVVGLGAYSPSGSRTPVSITLDDNGMVWTVDNLTLNGWSISSLIANGISIPTAPSKSLAITGCSDITFGVTSGGHHYLFVRDATSHIYSINPITPSVVNMYTDGSSRSIDYLLFTNTIGASTFLWASTLSNNVLLKIDPDTMMLVSILTSSGTNNNLEYLSQDGTYIYASDTSTGNVELFNSTLWNSEIIPTVPGETGSYGMVFDGSFVNVISRGTYPAVQELLSFGPGNFFIGPNELTYQAPTFIGTYAPSAHSVPTRGNLGESQFSYINLNTSDNSIFPLATGALININADSQTIISAYSNSNAPNNINLLSSTNDQAIMGDVLFCQGVQLLSTKFITSSGGRIDNVTTIGDGSNYSVLATDRIIYYIGSAGRGINLPLATGSGRILTIVGVTANNSTNSLLVNPSSTNIIGNGVAGATWEIYSGNGRMTIQDRVSGAWGILDKSSNNITLKKTSAYSISIEDDVIICDTSSSAAFTVVLPSSPNIGQKHEVHDVGGNAATNNITISGNGANINAGGSVTINAAYETRYFIWTGGLCGWHSYVAKVS